MTYSILDEKNHEIGNKYWKAKVGKITFHLFARISELVNGESSGQMLEEEVGNGFKFLIIQGAF